MSTTLVKVIECSRKSCGHILLDDERDWKPMDIGKRAICPKCGCESFYTVKENGQTMKTSEREKYRAGIDPVEIEPTPRMGPKRRAALLAVKKRALALIEPTPTPGTEG